MYSVKAFGNTHPSEKLQSLNIQRRKAGPDDVVIGIHFCGICHSDIHTARGEWGPTTSPCVPGHEIVGEVLEVGKKVKKHKAGDIVGVGCFVDSCGKCSPCKSHEEQFCEKHTVFTYASTEMDLKTPTLGGYSTLIVVKQNFVLKIKKNQPLERVAPLLCAGITTYSPLKRYGVKKGTQVGVVGLGGLGHMAVKLAKAMGAEVTVFSTSENKKLDAKKLGAKHFINTRDPQNFELIKKKLDVIIDTVSADHSLAPYLSILKVGGTHVLVGAPPTPHQLSAFSLIGGRKKIAGSLIGGIKETQEMLDFCAKKKVYADIELISADQINEAYERTLKGDVKYRFVIDAESLF